MKFRNVRIFVENESDISGRTSPRKENLEFVFDDSDLSALLRYAGMPDQDNPRVETVLM